MRKVLPEPSAAGPDATRHRWPVGVATLLILGLATALVGGCSVRKLAVSQVADALAQSGGTFARDDDPELIRDAAPFSLKLMESLLAESPQHTGLLLALAGGFTQYAYAFVQQEADVREAHDLRAAEELRTRAKRLYARARDYGLRGLEVWQAGWEQEFRAHPPGALRAATRAEVPLLYWTAASWAAGIALSKDTPESIADLPLVAALIDRALELDESYASGALHSFLITFEQARPSGTGDAVARSRRHFDRAVELTGGNHAGPLLAWAEAVSVQQQNAAEFKALLERALAIKVDVRPEWRLENTVLQRRARWLLGRMDDLILPALPVENAKPK